MEIKQNQYVRIYKLSALFMAFALGLVILFLPARLQFQADDRQEAKEHAKALAAQLLQRKQSVSMIYSKTNGRLPASAEGNIENVPSEGQIGLDPWGQPYTYSMLETDHGVARVVVRTTASMSEEELQSYVEGFPEEPVDAQDLPPEY